MQEIGGEGELRLNFMLEDQEGRQKGEDKMASPYHKLMQKSLIKFGNDMKNVRRVYEGNKKPLSIVDSYTKYVINYKPDVYFIKRNNTKIIFEILDTELKKQDIIIADVCRSCLVDNVEMICFIYSSDKNEDFYRIQEAMYIIVRGFSDKGVKAEEFPTKLGNYPILKSEAKDIQSVIKILKKISKDDKW